MTLEALGELWDISGELLGGLGRPDTALRDQNLFKKSAGGKLHLDDGLLKEKGVDFW